MAIKKKKPTLPEFPVVLETFRRPGVYERGSLTSGEPSCFNGNVSINRYRITFEEIPEDVEVLYARLLKLWRECTNHHHYSPMRAVAEKLGKTLPPDDFGKDRGKDEYK